MPLLIQNMILFANQRAVIEAYGCKDLASNFVKIISLYVELNPVFIGPNWKSLLGTFVFPLLRVNEE